MKKTVEAMSKMWEIFEGETRITKHVQKSTKFFWFLLEDFIISDTFHKL